MTTGCNCLPRNVTFGECWARDGLQSEEGIASTDEKLEVIKLLVEAGFRRIEVTSFAHSSYLPQFDDAEELLRRVPRRDDVCYLALCLTPKAVDRAINSKWEGFGVDEVGMAISSSEAYSRVNVNRGRDEHKAVLEKMVGAATEVGIAVNGAVANSFGCPIDGDVSVDEVIGLAKWWREHGASKIGFGDTTGSANPKQVDNFLSRILSEGFSADEIVMHFHDTRGWSAANCMVALSHGITHLDSSLGGVGGQPKAGKALYHKGHGGNTCTEDLVGMLEEMGLSTGIDLEKMLKAGHRVEEILGRRLRSNFLTAGPVPHAGIRYDKEIGIVEARQ